MFPDDRVKVMEYINSRVGREVFDLARYRERMENDKKIEARKEYLRSKL